MSEQTPSTAPIAAPDIAPVIKLSPSIGLNERIATMIAESAPTRVLDQTLKVFVDKEIDKRATALVGGINLANETRSALKKAQQPDDQPKTFGLDGKPIGQAGYTKGRLADIKKLTEKLAKIDKAIDAATSDKQDYSLLNNLKADIDKADTSSAETSE